MSINDYKLYEELGRGAFGVTFLSFDRLNNRTVAVKTIDLRAAEAKGVKLADLENEVRILKDVSTPGSPYVAQYYNAFRADYNGVPTAFIVSEYVEGSTLTAYINSEQGRLPPSTLWPLYVQLLEGLRYIHKSGIAHRDIKPDNILITKDSTIKYIDFGLGCLESCQRREMRQPGSITYEKICQNNCMGTPGTILYMPPEFFNNTRVNGLDSAKAHDVWSLVLVMYELANGLLRFPFTVLNPTNTALLPQEEVVKHIAAAPEYGSSYAYDDGRTNVFIDSLVVPDWKRRLTAAEIQQRMLLEVLARPWTGLQ